MECKCGGYLEVTLAETVAILKCGNCGRGELIPQAKPQEVFEYRARVDQTNDEKSQDPRTA
jgi:hypothetical protein